MQRPQWIPERHFTGTPPPSCTADGHTYTNGNAVVTTTRSCSTHNASEASPLIGSEGTHKSPCRRVHYLSVLHLPGVLLTCARRSCQIRNQIAWGDRGRVGGGVCGGGGGCQLGAAAGLGGGAAAGFGGEGESGGASTRGWWGGVQVGMN